MKKITTWLLCGTVFLFLTSAEDSCNDSPVSTSGITKATTTVQTDLNGNTIEQNAVIKRLKEDNKAGSIKHLYIISAYSGQVLIYSTVKGKVTSSGKRLSPSKICDSSAGFKIDFGGEWHYTDEVLSDDGTYGTSVEYIYWWDSKDFYHQQFITGGMIVHISNQPIAVKSVTINMETNKSE